MTMTCFEPLIVIRNISDLHPSSRNARTHSREQVAQLASSMREFGFTNPILVSETGEVVAGHGRFEAAKQLGMKTVPTITLSHMSPVQLRAYRLADNQLALNAGWDIELLAHELGDLGELEFDLPLLGFDLGRVDALIDEVQQGAVDSTTDKDDSQPRIRRDAKTKIGDVWELGRHRLICGDARDPGVYDRLLRGEMANLIFTDPPYNVPIDGHVCGSGRIRHAEFAMGVGEMSKAEFADFLAASLGPAAERSVPGTIAFVCMDWRHVGELLSAGERVFSELKNLCVWNKSNGGMGTFYRSKHELIFVFKIGSAPHTNNFGLGQNGRYRTNVWDYPGISSGGKARLQDLAMHPTVKPVAMISDAIRDCSRRGDIVLDPFAGSGSTLIAAHRTGRTARLIELDPHYCDLITRRFEEVIGSQAKLS
jgi:DNA modification methylase